MDLKKEMLYEGKAKQIFATEKPDEVVVRFKDDATAFNAQKKGQVDKKGQMNNAITTLIFEYLNEKGIPTHFIKQIDDREQLVKKVIIIPLEVIVRNYVAGSMAQRLGVEEGTKSPITIFDICYKDDALGDPLINDYHAMQEKVELLIKDKNLYHKMANINVEKYQSSNIVKELYHLLSDLKTH